MKKVFCFLCVMMITVLFPMGAQATRYYVTVDAPPEGTGASWNDAMSLATAISRAVAGDELWLMGYADGGREYSYVVPKEGYELKAGVRLYGGFAGTEASIDGRAVIDGKAYRMAYRTVLTADIKRDDTVDATNLIFPANTSRQDNATRVLTLNLERTSASGNQNQQSTVVDGITIARGHAGGNGGQGGGILVTGLGVNYEIRRCFFIENYAAEGGALCVADGVQGGIVDRCGFFNNAAGARGTLSNSGGAISLRGAGTVVNTAVFNNENGGILLSNTNASVINSTVARNTGAGIDGNSSTQVLNTVVWGNSLLSMTAASRPSFHNSAYPEANPGGTGGNDNVYLAAKNNEPDGPHFSSPSVKIGFDTDYLILSQLYPLWTWEPMEATPLVDAGDNGAYTESYFGSADLGGNARIAGNSIDIGAFEYQPMAEGRVRYVTPGGTGDGTSWDNASGNIQAMIDDLADNNPQQLPGEVWVAAGEYEPQSYVISGMNYSASFRMRSGISVYGGFDGTETSKTKRDMSGSMPWQFKNTTVLSGAYYDHANLAYADGRWTLTSDSRHVVWFAPMQGEQPFGQLTVLDGVTIRGGYAQGNTGLADFMTDCGAGVYIDGANARLQNCIVKENYATGDGGGVWLRDGRVQGSLIYNNNADASGGAVYVSGQGLVHRSMLANNTARNGAAVYLDNATTTGGHPEYLILSTCVVTNNTARGNGAVYCARGGVLLQNTIANNNCITATDLTDPNASQTGGIYIDGYALVANSVVWNNRMGSDAQTSTNIPMYARNPQVADVRFMYNAMSGVNNAVWNNTLQEQTLSLVDANRGLPDNSESIGPRFATETRATNYNDDNSLQDKIGVQSDWNSANGTAIDYYWKPIAGSNLWARGMAIGQLPAEVVLAPEIDIEGGLFDQKPAVGAFHVDRSPIVPALESNASRKYNLVIYVDADCTEPDHDGSSWATAYRSINEAVSFFAGLTEDSEVTVLSEGNKQQLNWRWGIDSLVIRVLEGDLWPRYAFVNDDPKTATLDILAMQSGKPLRIVGGYHRNDAESRSVVRDPLTYRSQLNGNNGGDSLEEGLYHVVTVEPRAKAELDGFHVINGYAAGAASLQYGAGMLVRDEADVTLTNCIFENNTAATAAAIDARNATLTMQNCVVNNNTNTSSSEQLINCPNLTMRHVTIINNVGAAPANTNDAYVTSFAAGNVSNKETGATDGMNNTVTLATTGADGAAHFANPTNGRGATLGFDTYLGGYSSFRPLTSSADAATHIINKGASTALAADIMGNERNLGGVPDLGAYEADLPRAGKVIYVRSYNTVWDGDREEIDGSPSMDISTAGDGSSWENAINGNAICNLKSNGDGNDFYIVRDGVLKPSSYDYDLYRSSTYGPTAGHYGTFLDGTHNYSGNNNNVITNNRDEQYVSGLQYAIEKASEWNKTHPVSERIDVWVGAGIYTDYKGFVIRDSVRVYGGFPNDGTPGEDDRMALLSGYIPSRNNTLKARDYETILQIRKESPVTWTNNNTGKVVSDSWMPGSSTVRHYVLYQPDVCVPTWAVENNNADKWGANRYRYNEDPRHYVEYTRALWDGFTVRHGYIKNYTANRDGGAGVRAFRGVTLQNLVVVNNYTHGSRSRGGGLYMDGLNSVINNSFLVNNLSSGAESYGGGAYMIVGTGFNMVVANNHAEVAGGGLFIESATFYNNTVAFNRTGDRKPLDAGNGSGIFQYAEANMTRLSKLGLYNCIIYGNVGVTYVDYNYYTNYQITSSAPTTFDKPYNCYVSGRVGDNIRGQFVTNDNVYRNQVGENLPNPFARGNSAQSENNYRLAAGSTCLNTGTENLGDGVSIPDTDMDYTNRIKDCTIDIGAYESDNEDNIKYTQTSTSGNSVGTYYVSQNGAGSRSGENEANAACAMKLQNILTDAGEKVKDGFFVYAVVKVAGYEDASFVYNANTLADANSPQSYTYVVPAGVTLMGGYNDEAEDWNNAEARDVMRFRTVLSAVAVPAQGSTITQEVQGFHAVTFGSWPGTAALDREAVIDGLWLTDGSATSLAGAGNPNTRGGGAIVPAGAHVRNCIVKGCEAIDGGGLYLLPGATVSGTAVLGNSADNGGGIYADNTGADADSRAHIISCTIADNTADEGGGLYLEDGAAMSVNTVIWGNDAPSGRNVSGVGTERFVDSRLASVFVGVNEGSYYPFNDCFIESQEMPSDFENASMTGDSTLYFADSYRRLKEFSPLIKHGVSDAYQDALGTEFGVSAQDVQGIDRSQQLERIDAGAFAYDGGVLPTAHFTRLFVSQTANVKLPDEGEMMRYLGRSFYTSFSTIDDALAYIRQQREDRRYSNTEFEILVSGGTYKPATQRITSIDVPYDQRLYSFSIPHGVSIYGGFSGMELISSGDVSRIERADGPALTLTPDGNIDNIINARTYSDFNQNGIEEAWELANQTILSGNINVSADARNVYHVIFTDAAGVDNPKPVTLDGLTVMNGETSNELSEVSQSNEQGRGGGIYSDGVGYTLSRCRLMNNYGVRGGAVFVRDARLNVVGSIFAGNGWSAGMEPPQTPNNQPARGGAIFLSGVSDANTSLYAVNSLFVNNETTGQGGAIGTNFAEGVTTTVDPLLDIMNCTFARNKAQTNAVLYNHNGKSTLTNTLIWGNESQGYDTETNVAHVAISHSASDYDYKGLFVSGNNNSNILLAADNNDASGPRFVNPAATAGIGGNDATDLWNPAAISVVTDAGDGQMNTDDNITGAYGNWFVDAGLGGYADQYMGTPDYLRYSGPVDPKTGKTGDRPIDIGAYEYQYVSNFQTMLAIYVATEDAGNHSGDSWANATSDLRGAIAGASNPAQTDGTRTIYVRDGDYSLPRLSARQAYVLLMAKSDLSDSLVIKGSCTGVAHTQDFGNQTVVRNHPNAGKAENLFSVNANEKVVVIEGFTFINGDGRGMEVATDADGTFTLKNGALRANGTDGMHIGTNNGSVLIYNTLFADNEEVGLTHNGKTTLVNTTFANNGTDLSAGNSNLSIYNTVSWNNRTTNINHAPDGNHNYVFNLGEQSAQENNEDIEHGPNFRDPLNDDVEGRDYRIRPSLTLLNKGGNRHYTDNVPGIADGNIPAAERDLAGNPRLTDGTIDIGAYEYEAPLRPIVYVKADVVAADADGSSWDKALDDLQGAADLAGIYANNNPGESGYVFVHNNIDGQSLRLTLPNTKVYGGMNDEQTTEITNESGSWEGVAAAVNGLLTARSGLLERTNRTKLSTVLVNADAAVADGFEVTGNASVTNGYLSTSIVNGNVGGGDNGILYNALVYRDVENVKAVNVTATGAIKAADGSANNRSAVTETNTYVTGDHWEYQLMETSDDIDHEGNNNDITNACIDSVGHSRDIAGNKRIRNTVDNGCFETWDLKDCGVVTAEDYPHGQSVVYVRSGKELLLNRDYTAASPFCPGVLLLEHRAGLRGNGKNIGLGNVIVERNVAANSIDMAYVPFDVSSFVNDGNITVKYYDGAARAAYDYTFDSTDGKAWSNATTYGRTGLLLDNSQRQDEACVRFVGKGNNVYTEGPDMNAPKQVTLAYNNFNEPWATPADGGNRFTHKENMSWNLFGSPYLCAMNYDDMEYGRVIYGHNGSNYVTLNTTEANENGYIPAGDAVFTQTATLKSAGETFDVAQPDEDNVPTGEPYGGMAALQLSVAAAGGTRAAEIGGSDVLQLNAVEAASARTDFDPMADGVKWMADSAAQIYATRGTGRYSLLSAVSREGEVAVDLTLPEAGTYTIGLPEDCAAGGYEAVTLTDAATGRTTDLLAGDYDFSVAGGGDVAGRFTVSFRRMAADRAADGISIWSPSPSTVAVSGLEAGDEVRVFTASGVLAAQAEAAFTSLRLAVGASGLVVVEVTRNGATLRIGKVGI